ncbi:hypothetical protein [Mucilaginibacter sp. FT3.2]|uniref:hypothetical protein n=1 Tax=Mucilaginibacter sp. FT3.2 TaxID=2723090 RepID=UPI001622AA77|nr:hypothetical protein [Mucilaginibacter sp. FT3.2]MBB6233463.1 hypothetical protein [Mucilaginibacter sp. FT3.2]
MEQLTLKYKNPVFNNSLVRIGDLINYDGPILSLFEDVRNGYLYLFDWVDRIEQYNRWLIFQIRSKDILEFIQKKITYLELFKNTVKNTYYFTDIINNNLNNYRVIQLEIVPEKYYPNANDYFDKTDCPSYDKIVSFLLNKKSENLYLPNTSISSINNHRTQSQTVIRKKSRNLNEMQVNSNSPRLTRHPLTAPNKNRYDITGITIIRRSEFNYKKHA